EPDGPLAERPHRLRLGLLIERCPRLLRFWHHNSPVLNSCLSADGSRVAVAGSDGVAQVWDVATGESLPNNLRHDGEIYQVVFSPNGKLLATAGADGTACIWDLDRIRSNPLVARCKHNRDVRSVAFSPDGRWLLTASLDRTAVVWSTEKGQPRFEPIHHS